MREVSCRALGQLFKTARKRGLADSVLVAETSYDPAYLRDSRNRIGWDEFCAILRNAGNAWSLHELSDLNEAFMRSPFFAYVGLIARVLFTSRDLFDWICKRSVGGGAQLFSDCVQATYRHVGSDVTIIQLEIQPAYEASPEFFWMTRGAFVAMPRLVGAGSADVNMAIEDRKATYRIRYKNKRGTLSSLVRWLSYPFTARAAARELQGAHEELQARYYELEAARGQVEHQRELIDQAYRLGHEVWGHRDLGKVVEVVTSSLVAASWVCGVRLVTGDLERSAGKTEGPPGIELELPGGHGRLEAWADDAARPLLELLAPTVALAIENAAAYRELGLYQIDLEKLVDERTMELRQARDELAETVTRLREAQSAREIFFGNISHEIRTPLSLILLAAGDIERRAGNALDERGRRSLTAVGEAARKLVRLVDELLLLAAGQEGKLKIRPEPSELASLVDALAAAWRPAAEAAGLELVVRAPAQLAARIDPIAIERVAANLVSNAVKYTPRDGRIEIELVRDGDAVRLSVLDTGPGIDAELAHRLFGRFERAEGAARRQIGTGIGLSLVKQLVEAHGGTVEALARQPHGAELRVVLPGVVVERAPEVPGVARLRVTADSPPTVGGIISGARFDPPGVSAGTIVVAEDDPRLAEEIARLLGEEYTVHVGLDGDAALDLVRRHQPQLLVTDVAMPGMTGIELARKFRELTGDRLAPIIILSAVIDLGSRLAGLEAGATDYVTKPFEPIELRARVHAQLRTRQLAVRLHQAEQVSTLGMLTSGLAHELRNPANGIVNAIAPLRALLPPELTTPESGPGQLLEVMQECAQQIGDLSRQLLGFRRGTSELVQRVTTLADLVQRASLVARRPLEGVELRRDIADATVRCAPALIVQVLANLLENAAHAVGRGGWVEIIGRTSHDKVAFEVSDSGTGVPVELHERIFEPFFTTKPPGIGTGLGLSVARAIAQRHGGALELRARGARHVFMLELPADKTVARTADAI